MQLAQAADTATREEVCGVDDVNELCVWLWRATNGNELVARAAGAIGTLLRVLVILALAVVLTRLARGAVARFSRTMERRIQARLERGQQRGTLDAERYRGRRFQRLHAITGVLKGAAAAVVWVVAIFAVLDAVHVSLQPILAGAGLLGIVIGFGAQQLIRDVLAGIAMLIEDQYGVGDWIEIDKRIGQVERVGLRVTSVRDLDGIVWHTLNGHVQQVGNLSQEWSRSMLDVPIALDSDVPAAKAIIHKVASDLADDPLWGQDIIGPPEIWGVQEFGPEGLAIRVVMPTKPMANWDINRQMRERLHRAFGQASIRMQGRLLEVGGMATGYPLLWRESEDDGQVQPVARRRGLVPADIGPLDRPPGRPDGGQGPTGAVSRPEWTRSPGADDDVPLDQTAELRLERGREPRPD